MSYSASKVFTWAKKGLACFQVLPLVRIIECAFVDEIEIELAGTDLDPAQGW